MIDVTVFTSFSVCFGLFRVWIHVVATCAMVRAEFSRTSNKHLAVLDCIA